MKATFLTFSLALLITSGAPPMFAQQQSSTKPAQDSATAKPKKSTQTRPDEGAIVNGIYSENFFLLRYALPQGWIVKTPEMRKDLPGQGDSILLLSAFAKATPSLGEINSSVSITAESAASSSGGNTPEDYLESIAELVSTKGFTVLNPPGELTIGGVTFVREDFQKQEGDLNTYQATMVSLRRGYILQVTAISGNEEQLTPLLNRLQITAPPTLKRP